MNNEATSDARPGFAGRSSSPLGEVIQIDQNLIKDHLDKVVVQTVEQTLNALLDAEADLMAGRQNAEAKWVRPGFGFIGLATINF